MNSLDQTQRKIAGEKLYTFGVIGHVIKHELYRVTAIHSEGLTPKEVAYLKQTFTDLETVLKRAHTVMDRTKVNQ